MDKPRRADLPELRERLEPFIVGPEVTPDPLRVLDWIDAGVSAVNMIMLAPDVARTALIESVEATLSVITHLESNAMAVDFAQAIAYVLESGTATEAKRVARSRIGQVDQIRILKPEGVELKHTFLLIEDFDKDVDPHSYAISDPNLQILHIDFWISESGGSARATISRPEGDHAMHVLVRGNRLNPETVFNALNTLVNGYEAAYNVVEMPVDREVAGE